jgi:ATP-dependent Clp protease, protease subunit
MKLNKHPLQKFVALAQGDVLTIYAYGLIGEIMFGDGITASAMVQLLAESSFSSITMRINSPGGDPFEAATILNLLKETGKPINVYVDGLAASAGSLLAMVGTTIHMGEGAMFMIHNASSLCFGTAEDMRQEATNLDDISAAMRSVYVNRTKMSDADMQKLMDAETWLTADKAVEMGFADSKSEAPSSDVQALTASYDLSMFKKAPKMQAPAPVQTEEQTPSTKVGKVTVDLVVNVKAQEEPTDAAEKPAKVNSQDAFRRELELL